MKKILVSWIATNHDFLIRNQKNELVRPERGFNENGPHFSLYRDFKDDYDVHYLLSQHKEEGKDYTKWMSFANALQGSFNKKVVLKFMNIPDILNVGAIKNKIDDLIRNELKNEVIDIFVNPGAPSMQIAWYLLGSEMTQRKNVSLFRRRESRFIKNGGIPQREYMEFENSDYSRVTNILDGKDLNADKQSFITASLQNVYDRALKLATNNKTTTLIHGESGTGKEYLAHYIHKNSNRKSQPYIAINCGALRGDLLESRLFGYAQGAFTGATETRKGAFEDAQGGTIFLDEIGDISPRMQVTLLRLEEQKLSKIGSTKEVDLDVRVIVATNKDLYKLCKKGKFRFDLYYRLVVAELNLPSFRDFPKKERKIWINYFLETTYTKLEKRYLAEVSKEVWEFLLHYPFYGNFRELRNLIENFYTFCDKKVTFDDIPKRMLKQEHLKTMTLDYCIKEHVTKIVKFCDGNLTEAGNLLGRNRATVRKFIEEKNTS